MTRLQKCPLKGRFCWNATALLQQTMLPQTHFHPAQGCHHFSHVVSGFWKGPGSAGHPRVGFSSSRAAHWPLYPLCCPSLSCLWFPVPQLCLSHVVRDMQPTKETLGDKPRCRGRRRDRNRAGAASTAISAPRGAAPALGPHAKEGWRIWVS